MVGEVELQLRHSPSLLALPKPRRRRDLVSSLQPNNILLGIKDLTSSKFCSTITTK